MTEAFLAVNKNYLRMGLKSIDILIIFQIAEYSRNKCQCFVTNQQFADMFGESISTVKRAIERLENQNIIKRITSFIPGNGRGNKQRVLSLNDKAQWKVLIEPSNDLLESSQTADGRFESNECMVHNEPIKENLKDNLKENLLKKEIANANRKSEKQKTNPYRELCDLSDDEKQEIVTHYKDRTMKYPEMYVRYNLAPNSLSKDIVKSLESELKKKARTHEEQLRKNKNYSIIRTYGLTPEEGDEFFTLTENVLCSDFLNGLDLLIEDFISGTNMSLYELLQFLRNNELATRKVFDRNQNGWGRFEIPDEGYSWKSYYDYLEAFTANPEVIAATVKEYEEKKNPFYVVHSEESNSKALRTARMK